MIIPKRNLNKRRKIVKTFTLPKEALDNLEIELKIAGYKKGIEDINFSDLLERLIVQYTDELKKDNKEDEKENK